MTELDDTQGQRIRDLFANARQDVSIIAPFIRTVALQSLLDVVDRDVPVRCVTRWLPREIASGVSEPEILDVLEERDNATLSLVDNLHAKLFIADDECLAGSSNVTLAGLGDAHASNIEVLVATSVNDDGVASTLAKIGAAERTATRALAIVARALADSLLQQPAGQGQDLEWFPRSRRPKKAYRLYVDPTAGGLVEADRLVLADIARANLAPALDEPMFRSEICAVLGRIPLARALLGSSADTTLTRADAQWWLESIAGEEYSSRDLWLAFVGWMTCFFPEQLIEQPISEVALRRAQLVYFAKE